MSITENNNKKLNYTLWVEKYRPSTIKDVILPKAYKNFFDKIISEKDLPNLLLYASSPGNGKTSTAKALVSDLDMDYLYINTSSESGIDTLRDKISKFASTMSFDGKKKAIILDEFDGASINLQQGLRAAIEEFHDTCRFVLTCNYVTKIIEPLKSRCQMLDFNFSDNRMSKTMMPKIGKRILEILDNEKIEYDKSTIIKIVKTFYPDMRKMLGLLQQYSKQTGIINAEIFNYQRIDSELFELVLNKKMRKAREYVIQKNYNYSELYRALYDNVIPRIDQSSQGEAYITVAEYMYRDSFVIDKEINFFACLIELARIL
ncbi:MAG: AAA family ATPase [Candidatus Pacearchaeota archaeon]